MSATGKASVVAVEASSTAPRGGPLIDVQGVCKIYGRDLALRAVDLHVDSGELFGLVGRNGAGKSTLIRILLGLTHPTCGRATVGGWDCRHDRAQVGRLVRGALETHGLYRFMSAFDHLRYLGRLAGTPVSRSEAGELLDMVGLADAGDKPVSAYSTGMRRKLVIAQALLGRPRVVLLDEPTAGLDPPSVVAVREMLVRLRSTGVTLLVSSHMLSEVAQVCTRIAVLEQGCLVATGSVGELCRLAGGTFEVATADVVATCRRAAILDDVLARPAVRTTHVRVTSTEQPDAVLARLGVAGDGRAAPEWCETTLEDAFLALTDRVGKPG